MIDLAQHLNSATTPERVVPICLRGDLTGRLKDAEAYLQAIQHDGDEVATIRARARVQRAKQEVQDAALPFRLRGLTREEWRQLVDQHPAREGESSDRLLGFDPEAFLPALVRACLVDPVPTDEQWRQLLDSVLTFGQWDRLAAAAMDVSRHENEILVPFGSAGSAPTAAPEPTSSEPATFDSASGGSTAGSRVRRTSTTKKAG